MILIVAFAVLSLAYIYFGIKAAIQLAKESTKDESLFHSGMVANLNEFGYDVVDRKGEVIRHITTGDVRCDLGVCDHENHR